MPALSGISRYQAVSTEIGCIRP